MTAPIRWTQRHQLLPYLILAFGISWIGVVAVVGPAGFPGTEEAFGRLLLPVVVVMLLGPSVAGIAATAIADGRAGLRDLLQRATRWQVGARWWAAALLTAPVAVLLTVAALGPVAPVYRIALTTVDAPVRHLLIGLVTGLAAGFFEEIGWSGVAIPTLRRRFTPVVTGLILGVIWGAWHAVASYWGSTSSAGAPLAIYLPVVLFAYLVPYRILMVLVYERTQSVFVAMAMHAALTGSFRILEPVGIVGWDLVRYCATLGGTMWAAVALVGFIGGYRRT